MDKGEIIITDCLHAEGLELKIAEGGEAIICRKKTCIYDGEGARIPLSPFYFVQGEDKYQAFATCPYVRCIFHKNFNPLG